jgi:hypothetical protein
MEHCTAGLTSVTERRKPYTAVNQNNSSDEKWSWVKRRQFWGGAGSSTIRDGEPVFVVGLLLNHDPFFPNGGAEPYTEGSDPHFSFNGSSAIHQNFKGS